LYAQRTEEPYLCVTTHPAYPAEDFIKPLLNLLEYQSETENNIEREVALKIPFVKSKTKKISISTFPDYVLSINGLRKWVLDAKNTSEAVKLAQSVVAEERSWLHHST
jgi:hypothetical protein